MCVQSIHGHPGCQANVERSISVKELQKVLPAPASDSFVEALTIAAREAREGL